jgi:hypothetical protein
MRLFSWHSLSLKFDLPLRLLALTIFGVGCLIASPPVAGKQGLNKNGDGTVAYYLEFRARGGVVGHTYMIAGRILGNGRRVPQHHFGFSPASNDLSGNLQSLIGTPGSIGPQPLDFKMPTLAQFNVRLTSSQYRQLERTLRRSRTHVPAFRLLSVNCNYFAGYIARSVGLRSSADTLKKPAHYVLDLARLNSGASTYRAWFNGQRAPGSIARHGLTRRA